MPWTGGCLCGAVRYEAAEAPRRIGYCHCRMCQKAGGAPFAVAGTLNNGPGLVLDSTTGGWAISGGRIVGGTIDTLDGTVLSTRGQSSVLDGVTLNGTMTIGASVWVKVENGMTINGAVRITGGAGSYL